MYLDRALKKVAKVTLYQLLGLIRIIGTVDITQWGHVSLNQKC